MAWSVVQLPVQLLVVGLNPLYRLLLLLWFCRAWVRPVQGSLLLPPMLLLQQDLLLLLLCLQQEQHPSRHLLLRLLRMP